ncbi:hypothetical protein BGX30_010189 [Mortierella sp. GBA39]|nr:hypothetical protein BGX30_010189 [Mortierella sp. GBA39]
MSITHTVQMCLPLGPLGESTIHNGQPLRDFLLIQHIYTSNPPPPRSTFLTIATYNLTDLHDPQRLEEYVLSLQGGSLSHFPCEVTVRRGDPVLEERRIDEMNDDFREVILDNKSYYGDESYYSVNYYGDDSHYSGDDPYYTVKSGRYSGEDDQYDRQVTHNFFTDERTSNVDQECRWADDYVYLRRLEDDEFNHFLQRYKDRVLAAYKDDMAIFIQGLRDGYDIIKALAESPNYCRMD